MHINIIITDDDGNKKTFGGEIDPSQKLPVEPPQSGVYRLHSEDGTILYIGSSKDLDRRIKTHISEKRIPFYDWSRLFCPESEIKAIEDALIKLHQPEYNKRK